MYAINHFLFIAQDLVNYKILRIIYYCTRQIENRVSLSGIYIGHLGLNLVILSMKSKNF